MENKQRISSLKKGEIVAVESKMDAATLLNNVGQMGDMIVAMATFRSRKSQEMKNSETVAYVQFKKGVVAIIFDNDRKDDVQLFSYSITTDTLDDSFERDKFARVDGKII